MPTPYTPTFMFSTASLVVLASSGEEIWIASMLYNATISALEVRAYRHEGCPPGLVEAIGASPLRILERAAGIGGTDVLRAIVHFESATLGFPFECDPGGKDLHGNVLRGTECIKEVVILRGLRVEVV